MDKIALLRSYLPDNKRVSFSFSTCLTNRANSLSNSLSKCSRSSPSAMLSTAPRSPTVLATAFSNSSILLTSSLSEFSCADTEAACRLSFQKSSFRVSSSSFLISDSILGASKIFLHFLKALLYFYQLFFHISHVLHIIIKKQKTKPVRINLKGTSLRSLLNFHYPVRAGGEV